MQKLEAVRSRLAEIDPRHADVALLEADAADPVALKGIAEAARVIITTVGPYAIHGEPLVAACAAAGTDYLDLTGEPEFVDNMWLRHHEQAEETGARIIHCAGFDSIPHDLGAYFTVQQLPEGVPLKVEGFVSAGGQLSGGTLAFGSQWFRHARETMRPRKERRAREHRPPAAKSRRPRRGPTRVGRGRLGRPDADDRSTDRLALGAARRALRARLHLWPLPAREAPAP